MNADSASTADELAFSSVSGAAALLRAGKISPVDLVRACLGRIEAHNPVLNAFITVTAESALPEAIAQRPKCGAASGAARCTASRSRSKT